MTTTTRTPTGSSTGSPTRLDTSSLPFETYHRTSQVGEGTYGSVVTVYNDHGHEFALKLFWNDDDDNDHSDDDDDDSSCTTAAVALELGTLREISILRLLRCYPHPNVIRLHDIQAHWTNNEEDASQVGAGTAGCLGMALPLYRAGSLADAIERQTLQGYPRRVKVQLAHDILSAVVHLHDNGILHRDIKSGNICLQQLPVAQQDNDEQEEGFRAILIDFSLAKSIDYTIYGIVPEQDATIEDPTKHTGDVGTFVYNPPEVLNDEPYGKPMDLWSVGVVLLELLLNEPIEPELTKPKQVFQAIQDALSRLPDSNQPFPALVRALLQHDPSQRLTARQALRHPLFAKFDMPVPGVQHMHVAQALPYDNNNDDSDEQAEAAENAGPNQPSTKSGNKQHKNGPQRKRGPLDRRLEKRLATIDRICRTLESSNPITRLAALEYSVQLEQLDDGIDEPSDAKKNTPSQALLDCVVLAHKFFDMDLVDLSDLDQEEEGVFANWTLQDYVDNEATIFMILDYCLYPRNPQWDC